MLQRYSSILRTGLCCCAVGFAGCASLIYEGHIPRHTARSECPEQTIKACTRNSYGLNCGCVQKRTIEAVLRTRQ